MRLVKCPKCRNEIKSKPIKKWKYAYRDVENYICEKCNQRFNLYITKNSQYTKPKSKR